MSDGEVVERFLTFIAIESHTGEALATAVLKFLTCCDIDTGSLYEVYAVRTHIHRSFLHLSMPNACANISSQTVGKYIY
ncbi:hypothetical protein EMCRGX_G007861 [Ephydatia muelleri]